MYVPGARVGAAEAKSVVACRGSVNPPRVARGGVGEVRWGERSEEAHARPCSQGGGKEEQDPF